jgi:hypothetical protein
MRQDPADLDIMRKDPTDPDIMRQDPADPDTTGSVVSLAILTTILHTRQKKFML